MKVVFIDVINNMAGIKEIEDDLHTFYDMIQCRCVEMPERSIGVKEFTIICDEEALLKDSPILSAVDREMKAMLFGNLIICKANYETGELEGLTDSEATYVMDFVKPVAVFKSDTFFKVGLILTHCTY